MSQLFDDTDLVVEVPVFKPIVRKGLPSGSTLDERLLHDYPPEWDRCSGCGGKGSRVERGPRSSAEWKAWLAAHEGHVIVGRRGSIMHSATCHMACLRDAPREVCPDCLGMGSLKARVRLEAGHRCVRCKHPYMPKGDAKMLTVMQGARAFAPAGPGEMEFPPRIEPSGLHPCETCNGAGMSGLPRAVTGERFPPCPDCKGSGKRWSGWSACDERCEHGGPIRVWNRSERDGWIDSGAYGVNDDTTIALRAEALAQGWAVEAAWRILTVHHLNGSKADCRWGNLAALCQVCHLTVQGRIVMERVYPHPHSAWFRPNVAWHYAVTYLGEDLTRAEVEARMDDLLALELDPAYG